jgi:hypothetical protein
MAYERLEQSIAAKTPDVSGNATGLTYEIIIGSYGYADSAQAEARIRLLNERGTKAHLVSGTKLHKISTGSFTDKSSANRELIIVRERFADAWIDSIKSNPN